MFGLVGYTATQKTIVIYIYDHHYRRNVLTVESSLTIFYHLPHPSLLEGLLDFMQCRVRTELMYIFTYRTERGGCITMSLFKRSVSGLNSEFCFSWTSCHTKVEELSLPYYLQISSRRIIGFMPFPRILACVKSHTVPFSIWFMSMHSFPKTVSITSRTPPIQDCYMWVFAGWPTQERPYVGAHK